MAAKKQSNKRGTTKTTSGKKTSKKRTTKKQGVTSGFQTEIILWIFFAGFWRIFFRYCFLHVQYFLSQTARIHLHIRKSWREPYSGSFYVVWSSF